MLKHHLYLLAVIMWETRCQVTVGKALYLEANQEICVYRGFAYFRLAAGGVCLIWKAGNTLLYSFSLISLFLYFLLKVISLSYVD
ncbi:hypothetical protein C1N53_15065 [Pontibacter sp. SGAir0037]|nr:hypothetical protein C1N53_15065 [Pontibacter sp. SGAir0037]